ncbi:MAG: MaoC family dehydratase [Aquabacterium sp.]|nr:MaoC family dehydratase [Aquabacterium sp.]MDO9283292.1 MaoC family dehydratase [Aquabacterium sp.]
MDKQLKTSTQHVDFDNILKYAAVTNDYNPIHVDKEFAAKSPMGGIIAHGTMSVALIWQALRNTLGVEMLNRVHLEIRFVQPVRIDDDVSGGGELREGSMPPVYDVWVRNGKEQDVIRGTAIIKPTTEKTQ